MGRDEQKKLVTDLKLAFLRASEKKLDWICEQIREALYQANLGLEPENLEQIRPLMMVLLKCGTSVQGDPSKEERQPMPAPTAEGKLPSLQDLRRRIYAKAKAEPAWRFWGLYVHVCKMETLREAVGCMFEPCWAHQIRPDVLKSCIGPLFWASRKRGFLRNFFAT